MKSRGYFKLRGAARAFDFDFRGKSVLDIGSSTGGFTAYALEAGARKVIAVEKGTGQMVPELKANPKVELYEKTDIFEFEISEKKMGGNSSGNLEKVSGELPEVIVADVSFISLRRVLKYAAEKLADKKTEFLVMLKPQFEAEEEDLNRGVVKNEKIRRRIIQDFEFWLKKNGFLILKKRDNQLAGKNGNVERFYWLKMAR